MRMNKELAEIILATRIAIAGRLASYIETLPATDGTGDLRTLTEVADILNRIGEQSGRLTEEPVE